MNEKKKNSDKQVSFDMQSDNSLDIESDSCLNSNMDRLSNAATSYVPKMDLFDLNLNLDKNQSQVISPIPGQDLIAAASGAGKPSTIEMVMMGIKDPKALALQIVSLPFR